MNLPKVVTDWISAKAEGTTLESVVTNIPAQADTMTPPCLTVEETSAEQYEQDGVTMRGVYNYELQVSLVTVPGDGTQTDTTQAKNEAMRDDLMNILANTDDFIRYADKRELATVFDIQPGPPIMEAEDGQLATRINLRILACPKF